MSNNKSSLVIFILFVVVAIGILITQLVPNFANFNFGGITANINRPTTDISIVYAPESDIYLKDVIKDFNDSFDKGINPVNGEKLKDGDKKVKVTGKTGSSGTIRTSIVNAVNGSNTSQIEKPTIFSPSVGSWLQLVNYETGREIFTLSEATPTAKAPVVIAIWESRLNLIKDKNPGKEIGWQELLQVLNDPQGWLSYSPTLGRKKVYYGHTDPQISSTGLSTLISEFYASSKYLSRNANQEQLTAATVGDPKVKDGVKSIESLIKHYSSRTTEFKEYIAQGPQYLDFVALEENDLIYINQGKAQSKPPEKLIALYPKEGTTIHEHPFGIVKANWVSEEQAAAAKVFTSYVTSEKVQQKVLENGFRPVNDKVALGYPLTKDLGVDIDQPKTILNTPTPEVISAVQQNWNLVKKRSEVYMLLDNSGSMDGEPLTNAIKALRTFVEKLPIQNQVGLTIFNSDVKELLPLKSLESNQSLLNATLSEVSADGSTALYDGLYQTLDTLNRNTDPKNQSIRAIILLSDGKDTSSGKNLGDVVNLINEIKKGDNPIFVIPIAYGKDADLNALNAIARASDTRVQFGDSKDIESLLAVISSYF